MSAHTSETGFLNPDTPTCSARYTDNANPCKLPYMGREYVKNRAHVHALTFGIRVCKGCKSATQHRVVVHPCFRYPQCPRVVSASLNTITTVSATSMENHQYYSLTHLTRVNHRSRTSVAVEMEEGGASATAPSDTVAGVTTTEKPNGESDFPHPVLLYSTEN